MNDILDLMRSRHSVRKYTDQPIEGETREALQACVDRCAKASDLDMRLMIDEPEAFESAMAHYGKFSNVRNYLILAGTPDDTFEERVGYWGQEVVLEAQRLGLNSCWVGLTFAKRKVKQLIPENEKLCCVVALGYGANQGVDRKSKELEDISNLTDTAPMWFHRGVRAAGFAPTAVNQQKFRLELEEIGGKHYVKAIDKGGFFSRVDMGIVKHDFELAAGAENFIWK